LNVYFYLWAGFVALEELLSVPMLGQYTAEEVQGEIKNSHSHRGSSRFQCHVENDKFLVRASYGRKMEKVSNKEIKK
jgi:hypothetical protein